jgi:hypothetical protein
MLDPLDEEDEAVDGRLGVVDIPSFVMLSVNPSTEGYNAGSSIKLLIPGSDIFSPAVPATMGERVGPSVNFLAGGKRGRLPIDSGFVDEADESEVTLSVEVGVSLCYSRALDSSVGGRRCSRETLDVTVVRVASVVEGERRRCDGLGEAKGLVVRCTNAGVRVPDRGRTERESVVRWEGGVDPEGRRGSGERGRV